MNACHDSKKAPRSNHINNSLLQHEYMIHVIVCARPLQWYVTTVNQATTPTFFNLCTVACHDASRMECHQSVQRLMAGAASSLPYAHLTTSQVPPNDSIPACNNKASIDVKLTKVQIQTIAWILCYHDMRRSNSLPARKADK